jgi:phage terminase small subunit
MKTFTPRQKLFIAEFSRSQSLFHAAQAAQVEPSHEFSEALAFLADADVREAIREAISHQKPKILPEQIVDKLWKIALADPRELVRTRRICCRHCWGREFDYQRTRWEHKQHLKAGGEEEGGDGYDPRKKPNPACPECFGKGKIETEVTPTEELSDNALALIAGITVLPGGIRLRTHNPLKALELLGRHAGMFGKRLHMTEEFHREMQLHGEVVLDRAEEYNKDMRKQGENRPRYRKHQKTPEEMEKTRQAFIEITEQNTGQPITPEQLRKLDEDLARPAPEQEVPEGMPPINYREWYEQRAEQEPHPLADPLPFSHDPIAMPEHPGPDPPH